MHQEDNQEIKTETPEVEIDEVEYQQFLYEIEGNQNLQMGIVGGLIAAVIGAIAWAAVTVITDFQIGWMAVGVGFLVGYAVRITGKGISKNFGFVGAILSLSGCLAGNLFSICAIVSGQEGIPFFNLLTRLNPHIILELMKATFNPIDLLFYGIAVYEGYRFSFRQITEDELARLVRAKA
jgi:hypothetical protein